MHESPIKSLYTAFVYIVLHVQQTRVDMCKSVAGTWHLRNT